MKVLLLAGGWSPEREVSLKGGEQIAAALKERGHSVTLCDPAKDFERLMDMAREHDAAFINLHGAPGEDGLVQAILDRVNCPYQGAGPAGSFLALHKAAARQIFRDAGLNIPDGVFLPRHPGPNWKPDLQYPMFVKSNTGGSSLHLSRVTNEEELYTALNSLFSMGEEAIVETAVIGREVTCGVLGEEVAGVSRPAARSRTIPDATQVKASIATRMPRLCFSERPSRYAFSLSLAVDFISIFQILLND